MSRMMSPTAMQQPNLGALMGNTQPMQGQAPPNFSGGLKDSYGTPVANPTPGTTPYTPPPMGQPMGGMPQMGQQSTAMQQRTSPAMGTTGGGSPMSPMGGYGGVKPIQMAPGAAAPQTGQFNQTGGASPGLSALAQNAQPGGGSMSATPQPAQSPMQPAQGPMAGMSQTPKYNPMSGGGAQPSGPSLGALGANAQQSPGSSPAGGAAPSTGGPPPNSWSGFTPPTSGAPMSSQPPPSSTPALNGNSNQTASMNSAANGTGVSSPGGMQAQSGMPSWLGHATPQQMALLQQNPAALNAYAPGGSATNQANAQGGLGVGANGKPNWQNWGWSSPQGNNAGAFTPFQGGSQGNMGMQGGPGQQPQ